jgi:hypothetical protein
MLCGPCFAIRPGAGYTHTMSLVWIPFVFWGIDGWLRRRECRWLALAAGAAAAQIYAGYVPCFYFTALAAGFYALTELFFAEKKTSAAAGLLAVYPLAFALAAAQLLPGLMLAGESVRAGGIDTAGAAHGSLRWENLPLLVSPYLYGGRVWLEEGARALRWWGNEYPYFGIPFVGLGALLLAVVGLAGDRRPRNAGLVALALLALAVALGPRTPLAGWLREWLPGFAGLRMMGMMLVFFALSVTLLAGAGVSALLRGEIVVSRWLSLPVAAFGLALMVTGLWLWAGGGSEVFREWMGRVMDTPGYRHPDTAGWWARAAAGGGAELLLAGCWRSAR